MVGPGANLPWVRYGGDFGANAWHPEGGLSVHRPADLDRTLAAAREAGASLIRWFVLCDGRAGLDWTAGPPRLQPVTLRDLETALSTLGRHDLRMVPVLFDFTWAHRRRVERGVQLGGRAALLRDPVARHQLWQAVDGLLTAFGRDRRIAGWDLWNEPEWMASRWQPPGCRLSRRLVRRCLGELALHVRWHARQPVTVGLASVLGLPLCRDLALDLLQVHWYDHLERRAPLARPHSPSSGTPIVLGEFPTRGSQRSPVDIHRDARQAGYAAAWPWSLRATDAASDPARALAAIAPRVDET
jgi:hypothetical protein